jgi:hypothetical protein
MCTMDGKCIHALDVQQLQPKMPFSQWVGWQIFSSIPYQLTCLLCSIPNSLYDPFWFSLCLFVLEHRFITPSRHIPYFL